MVYHDVDDGELFGKKCVKIITNGQIFLLNCELSRFLK
jgi:hypothetical protein